MKDMMNRMLSLGFGIAETSKEQVEKLVEELVKKGELSRSESEGLIKDLMRKAEEAENRMKESVREGVSSVIAELRLATKDDIERLERKLDALSGTGKQED